MIEIRTSNEVEQMRPAGRFVAEVLQTLNRDVKVGMNLLEIDEMARKMVEKRGAQSCYVDYAPSFGEGPFGHYICTSVNDAVLHGMPFDYALEAGDLLSLDFACSIDGWVADSAFSLVLGADTDPTLMDESLTKLMKTTQEALTLGIEQSRTGKRIGDISAAIGEHCIDAGYGINTDFGGHGVGKIMHGEPHIPNNGKPGRGYKIRPGLVIAIEPWLLETTDEIYIDEADGWTIRSEDGSYGAHFEHTIAVTDGDPIVLTAWEGHSTPSLLSLRGV